MRKLYLTMSLVWVLATLAHAQTESTVTWSELARERGEALSSAFYRENTPGYKVVLLPAWPKDDDLSARPEPLPHALDLSQGRLLAVDSASAVGLDGPGFFAVNSSGVTQYTRNGDFVWHDGLLQTRNGKSVQAYPTDPSGKVTGPIGPLRLTLDPQTLLYGGKYTGYEFDSAGILYGIDTLTDPVTGQTMKGHRQALAQLAIANFSRPEKLNRGADVFLEVSAESGPARLSAGPGKSEIIGQKLEEANNTYQRMGPGLTRERDREYNVRRGTAILMGQIEPGLAALLQDRGLSISWKEPFTTLEARSHLHFLYACADVLAKEHLDEKATARVKELMKAVQPGLVINS